MTASGGRDGWRYQVCQARLTADNVDVTNLLLPVSETMGLLRLQACRCRMRWCMLRIDQAVTLSSVHREHTVALHFLFLLIPKTLSMMLKRLQASFDEFLGPFDPPKPDRLAMNDLCPTTIH